jgi:hypothetical protein
VFRIRFCCCPPGDPHHPTRTSKANLINPNLKTSIGTGYDLANSIFSPDGRNFQVEYAVKAVENGGTSIGIRCKDGVVLAVEKLVTSKLLKPNANKRIATVDRHLGVVSRFAPPTSQLPAPPPTPPSHPAHNTTSQPLTRAAALAHRYTRA